MSMPRMTPAERIGLLTAVVIVAGIACTSSPAFLLKATAKNSAILGGQFVQSPIKVRIPATDAIRLDVTEFVRDFEEHYNVYNGAEPNAIQVVLTGGKYHLAWQPKTTEF